VRVGGIGRIYRYRPTRAVRCGGMSVSRVRAYQARIASEQVLERLRPGSRRARRKLLARFGVALHDEHVRIEREWPSGLADAETRARLVAVCFDAAFVPPFHQGEPYVSADTDRFAAVDRFRPDALQRLEALLPTFPEETRAILLSRAEGASERAVARRLDRSRGWVRRRYDAGIAMLRASL
jgi:DNA-directed RNA polymerase specialized sigma24 family protein